jgi:beta-galactosidase
VQVLMRYHAQLSWLDCQPAAVTRKVGTGSITYIGAWPDEAGMKRAVQWMVSESGVKPDTFAAPEGVGVYRRVAKGREIFILENTSDQIQTVALPTAMTNVLTDEPIQQLELPVYGVAVLRKH